MKRKIMLQFMISILIIGLMASFINTTAVSYFMYATSDSVYASKMLANFSPDTFNIKEIGNVKFIDGEPEIDPVILEELKRSGSFIQFIDSSGKEIKSINKPDYVKISYMPEEMAKLIGSPEIMEYKMERYSNPEPGIVGDKKKILSDQELRQKKMMSVPIPAEKQAAVSGGVLRDGLTVSYDTFIQVPNGDPNSGVRMIVGIMRPKVSVSMFFYSFLKFFTEWDRQKLFTTLLTVLVTAVMGYLFSRRMAKPVVKITNGIAQMAAGNYEAAYPEKGLYSEVYTSLNYMGRVLHENEEERKRLEKMRADWITNISHDLKTPLASIKGYGEMLLDPEYNLTPEERKKYSEVIFNKSNYIEHLINDLKLVQKLRNNMLPLKKTDNDLAGLLREIVISILNDPKYEDRKISFESEAEQIGMSFDPVLLQRAFTNIIYNAILHNPEETQVSVSVNMTCDGPGHKVIVEIRDNGRGIPKEEQKNLFERYYRGTSTDSLHEGSGLGLTIAREVIEAHGGVIELESEIGAGTAIKVIFSQQNNLPES